MPLTTSQIIDDEYVELMCQVGKYLTPQNHVIAVSATELANFEGESICEGIMEAFDDNHRHVIIVCEHLDESDFILSRFEHDIKEHLIGIKQKVRLFPQVESTAFERFKSERIKGQ